MSEPTCKTCDHLIDGNEEALCETCRIAQKRELESLEQDVARMENDVNEVPFTDRDKIRGLVDRLDFNADHLTARDVLEKIRYVLDGRDPGVLP